MNVFTPSGSLSVSAGNAKMGAIPSVSLPPVTTCRADSPCKKDCYACKLCRLRPAVRNAYERNLDLYRQNPDQYFRELSAYMTISSFFRMHVSGDVPDPDYFARLVKVARQNKRCHILMFTKQHEIVNDYITGGGKIPRNLKIIFSDWGEWHCDNLNNFPTSNVIFKGSEIPKDWKICGGNCFECVCRGTGCWTLKKGETIAFYKH